jgi:hypothetical protein
MPDCEPWPSVSLSAAAFTISEMAERIVSSRIRSRGSAEAKRQYQINNLVRTGLAKSTQERPYPREMEVMQIEDAWRAGHNGLRGWLRLGRTTRWAKAHSPASLP